MCIYPLPDTEGRYLPSMLEYCLLVHYFSQCEAVLSVRLGTIAGETIEVSGCVAPTN
ncbi:hypothetical protein BR93DRAFT_925815 [Coniochaeta sp. PMI_546]|nr:hypothetical protein BR93DRAFT_925815 [Coniochaeta sp. PMI_546]